MRATFRAKLFGIVGVAALGFVVLIAVGTGIGTQIEQQLALIRDLHVPRLELGPRLTTQFEGVRRALQDAVAAQDHDALAATDRLRDQFLRELRDAPVSSAENRQQLSDAFEEYYDAAQEVSRRLIQGESGEALVERMSAMQAKQLRAADALQRTTGVDQRELGAAFVAVSEAERSGARIQLAFSLGSFALVLVLSLWVSRGLLRTVSALSLGFERFGRGVLREPISVHSRDELGMLAERANEMALSLARLQEERDRADWIRSGQARLMNELQGDLAPAALARRALLFLVEYLQLPAAALYRVGANGVLHPLSYCGRGELEAGASLPNIRPGEGLIGRAAAQTELMLIRDVPAGYLKIGSGLGDAPASALVLLPLVHAGKVTGVLELACWSEWTPLQSELLAAVRESLAVAIEVAASVETQRELLAETQDQAQRLAAQEEQVRRANDVLQLQQSELRDTNAKLSAISTYKSQFLANMSHELRTPLNSMLLLSNLLAENEQGNLTPKQIEFCKTVYGAGKDLLALINQVLDLARIESGKQEVHVESFDPSLLLQSAERIVGPLARDKGIDFIAELDANAPKMLTSDRKKIEQIMTNLLGNAVKFTERGSVRLRVGPVANGARLGRAELLPTSTLAIVVSDTGIGISPEHQRSVFAPFEQVDAQANRRYGGTGLGLAIARELTELLGGELQLQSTPGQGSTFSCYLPVVYAGSAPVVAARATSVVPPAPAPVALPDAPPTAATPNVLVIEDDPLFAQAVAKAIQDQGFSSRVANDGRTGLALAKQLVPGGIILDVRLPDVDGFAVMEQLRADPVTAKIPVHFVSAMEAREQGMALGAVGYLTKPASSSDLTRVVQSLALHAPDAVTRVLIIEEDLGEAQSLARHLQGCEFELHKTNSAEEALRALERHPFRCVVLDLGLPGGDAPKLLQVLQERSGTLRPSVVVYSSRTLSEAEQQRFQAYADALVLKSDDDALQVLQEVREFTSRLHDDHPNKRRKPLDSSLRLDGLKLLLVDDDMRTVYALSALLSAKGASVRVADTGRAALSELNEHPDVEIVLMDIMMPEMDGHEAMRRIREDARFKTLPIVALTANAMKGDSERCLESGATDYLPKPIDPDRLVSLLRSTMTAVSKSA